jgi:alanyl-tRNA synthetase
MRRAMRHAHLLGAKEPLMHRLVASLVQEMGAAYPELGRAQPLIEETLQREEVQLRRTLANGLKLLNLGLWNPSLNGARSHPCITRKIFISPKVMPPVSQAGH